MANKNLRMTALANLNLGIADLRNSESRAMINAEVERLREEAKASTRSNTLRQQQVAIALSRFPGFAAEPDEIGPTLKELQVEVQKLEGMEDVKLSAIRSHVYNMRHAGVIASAEVLESEGQGRYPHFFFLEDEESFAQIVNGDLVVRKGS